MFIRVLTLSSLLSILVFADQYATSVKPLFADNSSTKVIGKLLPTAEVEVIKKEGSRVLISISGFQDGNKPAIYFVAGKRILNAGFDGKAEVKFLKIGEEVVDKKVYSKVKVEVWTEDSDFTSDLKALYTKANDLFSQNCSMCHGLHPTKEFSANQWPSMFKSMAGRTGIDKKDYQLVIEYLQKHAKDM
ncbi:heme-binding protein [Helicobacter cholecystus]|uniref:Heme-binding protein n=1 Tax=Helicobacter cholecystus TaxID=45498 RepID=A0A3D8IX05_9HELI|nr:heme-binding protein [Helicobacter cholecystus]RDU69435.1 heme-binding protein [Helicobacter cholecystus]VEJ23984.1 cytochrome C-type haem-binding periplasmic protein [Helicobacter cholecystus]